MSKIEILLDCLITAEYKAGIFDQQSETTYQANEAKEEVANYKQKIIGLVGASQRQLDGANRALAQSMENTRELQDALSKLMYWMDRARSGAFDPERDLDRFNAVWNLCGSLLPQADTDAARESHSEKPG